MKCTIKSLLLSTFALFSVLFGSCIITSRNVSAVAQDFSFTESTTATVLCDDTSSSLIHCSDVLFLYLSNFDFDKPYSTFQLQCQQSGSSSWSFPYNLFSVSSLYDFSSYISYYSCAKVRYNRSTMNFPSTYSFNLSLSDTNPYLSSCPTCPEIPDNPYDPKFDEIKQAILIIPATALVIYFFFCIYRMLLKGRE